MAAFKRTLTIDQGASYDKTFTWKTGPKGSETPVDMTGCTGELVIRVGSTDVLTLTTAPNGGLTLGADGVVQITVTDAQTAPLSFRTGKFQLEVTFPSGKKRRLLEGQAVVNPELA